MILKTGNLEKQGFPVFGKCVNMDRFLFPCLEFHVFNGNRMSLVYQIFLKLFFFNIKA